MADKAENSGAVRPEPIDHSTLGRTPILDDDDLRVIIDTTGLELLSEVDRHQFRYWLNNTVEQTIRAQLTERLDQRKLKKLRSSIRAYKDLSRSLVHSEFPPPTPPTEWLAEVEKWIKEAERGLSGRKSGGAPHNNETMEFLPKALGLFHAGFGVEPDGSVSREGRSGRGAAFRFVGSVSGRVRERVDERKFSARVPPELAARARWTEMSDDVHSFQEKVNLTDVLPNSPCVME